MTPREAMLRPVLERPFDLAPRLIYADWLDDHANGPEDHAEASFIRWQIQACKGSSITVNPFGRYAAQWVEPGQNGLCMRQYVFENPRHFATLTLRNGMVERVECTEEMFLAYAAEWFGKWPIVDMRLKGKCPDFSYDMQPCYSWQQEREPGKGRTPWEVCREIAGRLGASVAAPDGVIYEPGFWVYQSYSIAIAAHSRACVAHGRSLVGLPSLEFPRDDPAH